MATDAGEAFVNQMVRLASKATGVEAETLLPACAQTESPIEAAFAVWFTSARDHLLRKGFDRFRIALRPQHTVTCPHGQTYRLDFIVVPTDTELARRLDEAGIEMKIGVELDGHDYHEKTKKQVIERNRRDRDLSALRWRIFHFSGSELYSNPILAAVEILEAGAEALDQAVAAFTHGRYTRDAVGTTRRSS